MFSALHIFFAKRALCAAAAFSDSLFYSRMSFPADKDQFIDTYLCQI